MKCLPQNKLAVADGNILHDWHAEVVAIRTFNRFLLDECLLISTTPSANSQFVRQRSIEDISEHEPQPFTIREDVQIHMYCSEAPCGDASMELTMAAQEDSTPWTSLPPTISAPPDITDEADEADEASSQIPGALRGRSNFSLLGAVRCKPSRPDAPPTLSKSCTDKLTLKQATSLLSSVTSTLLSPRNAYIHSLTLPASQHIPAACTRAFSRTGRLSGLTDSAIESWKGGYRWHPFSVQSTQKEFTWSRRSIAVAEKAVASNLSAVCTPAWQETLIGGVLQGRKQMDPRGASRICRRSVWGLAVRIAGLAGAEAVLDVLTQTTYAGVKENPALASRRTVKTSVQTLGLGGWVQNTGDSSFTLQNPSLQT